VFVRWLTNYHVGVVDGFHHGWVVTAYVGSRSPCVGSRAPPLMCRSCAAHVQAMKAQDPRPAASGCWTRVRW